MRVNSDREKQRLKGIVKTVHSYWAPLSVVDGSDLSQEDENPDFQLFDLDGRFLEETSSERALVQDPYKYIYKYDNQHNQLVRDEFGYEGDHIGTTILEQDGRGSIEKSYYSDSQLHLERIFDSENRLAEIVHYGLDQQVVSGYSYKYNKYGDILEETSFEFGPHGGEGRLRYRTLQQCDREGRLIEKTTFRRDGSPWSKFTMTFGDEDETVHEAHYDAKGAVNQTKTTRLNLDGFVLDEACYYANGSLNYKREMAYEYDQVGNWTKQTIYQWVTRWNEIFYEPVSLTRRTITYY